MSLAEKAKSKLADLEKRPKWNSLIQFVKFGMVGGINTVLSYCIVNGGYYFLHINEQICNASAFIITVFISFLLNSKFVFKVEGKKQPWILALLKVYVSYSVTGLFLSAGLIALETKVLGIPLFIGTFVNLIITIPINFLLNKFWAYKKRKE